jgi:hypothetical protein
VRSHGEGIQADVPHVATMQMRTIGGRPGFVDVECELCSVAMSVVVLWERRDGDAKK